MVLVGVGDHDAVEGLAVRDHKAQVGQDDIDTGFAVSGESEAEVDHQPTARLRGTQAIEIDVHADFAETAKGGEDEFIP